MAKTAVLYGASGLVGSCLLDILLQSKEYEKVIVVGRRSLGISNPKMEEYVVDYDSLNSLKGKFFSDTGFCTLGTTQKQTPDKNQYYKIEHDYPLWAAQLSKENGASQFHFTSSTGASLNSTIPYAKYKAETERDIDKIGFEQYFIYRPSFILGNRKEKRLLEVVSIFIFKLMSPLLIGKFKKYRGVAAQKIATTMYDNALSTSKGKQIMESDRIEKTILH